MNSQWLWQYTKGLCKNVPEKFQHESRELVKDKNTKETLIFKTQFRNKSIYISISTEFYIIGDIPNHKNF